MRHSLRNVAIIAHVDHGKTTLIDCLLRATGTVDTRQTVSRVMDSNELEKERGITILAKNAALEWNGYHINIVDTPGHADFGGEVERILSMVDSVLLIVDAVDGPMPQTRFVTQKAFARGLKPILVVNKIDREGARPDWVVEQVFDLFDNLGATDEQLDFQIIYASAIEGYACKELSDPHKDMTPLLEAIIAHVPPPDVEVDKPLQMQISALDYSSYVGTIGIGRISRGTMKPKMPVTVIDHLGKTRSARIGQCLGFVGLERQEIPEAKAGDIVAVTGIEVMNISDTLCDPEHIEALPALSVDEPTITMTFQVNDSPFAGREGKYVTSRKIRERLDTELLHNVALRVNDTENPDKFEVSGRGELHLSILLENMRREGYELAISRPQVIIKEVNGEQQEPYECVTIDIEVAHQGSIMEKMGERKANMLNMQPDSKGRVRLEYKMPSRGLIGFHTEFLSMTSGTGLLYHVFDQYGPLIPGRLNQRSNGALISNQAGKATGFSLWNLQERGRLLIGPQTEVYEGMVVGLHTRENDLVVNVIKSKQLTNVRASGTDENILLIPPISLTLESAIELIENDELVEITPKNLRIRKKQLKEHERKRANRQ